jgi:hypothetical protein
LKKSNPGEEAQKRLEDRINRLDAFTKMAVEVLAELRRQLKSNHE